MTEEKNKNVLDSLKTNIDGLSENEVKNRLEQYGKNKFPIGKIEPLYMIFLKQFKDPLIYILLFGVCISSLLKEFSDAIFIMVILSLNSLIGCLQEISARKSANSLQSMVRSKNIVVRNGIETEIDSEFITIGDIVILNEGTKVPADMILLSTNNLYVNESMLTGESEDVKKDSNYIQKENCQIQEKFDEVFTGTIITKGNAIAVVKYIGLSTEMGKIAEKITQNSTVETPLVIRMEKFSKVFTIIIAVSVIFIVIVNLLKGANIRDTFLMAVSLAVAAIPEGLPITITIALSIGMLKMSKKNAIVRNLSAVEALGSCTIIASDKTGTLTQNEMMVCEVFLSNCEKIGLEKLENKKNLTSANFNDFTDEERGFLSSVLSNEAGFDGKIFFGDAVDIAFLKYVINKGYSINDIRKNFPSIKRLYYSSENRCAASFVEINGKVYAFVKGATETILSMCKNKNYDNIIEKMNELSESGMRVLSVCCGEVEKNNDYDLSSLKNLDFLSLLSMLDPLRKESLEAVNECQKAGIKIIMITGDNPKTAFAIGKQLNFVDNQAEVKTGQEVRETLNKGQKYLDELTKNTKVYSRMEPTQKLDIVDSLIRNGNFVAVTGDGVNDAPALKNSNVGIAMGKSGTDIARESADIVLMDDNFLSITKAVEEGRIVYNNIRKVIYFAVSCGLPKVLIYILSIIFNIPMPFSASQLLWLNVMTEGVQNISLAFEGGEGEEMKQKPRDPNESIFNKVMLTRLIISMVSITLLCFSLFYYLIKHLKFDAKTSSSMLLMLFVFIQNMQVLNSRSENTSIFKHSFLKNKKIIVGIFAAITIHIFASKTAFFANILKLEPLNFNTMINLFMFASLIIVVSEVEKLIRKLFQKLN